MQIKTDPLTDRQVIELLQAHLDSMAGTAPPESRHALDLAELRQPEITFWTIWDDTQLAGMGAIKHLTAEHAEIKSMRTAAGFLRRGIAARLLEHIIAQARLLGYRRLSLETGSMAYFLPAQRLYSRFGFVACEPFADYRHDPHSVYMTLVL